MREEASGEVRIKLHITTKTVHHPQTPSVKLLDTSAKYGKLGFEDIESSLRKHTPVFGHFELPPVGDYQVKNIWMCLNYSMRPTVSHVIEYIRKYYNYFSTSHEDMLNASSMDGSCLSYQQQQQQQLLDDQIKLYLDGYWLPPYESSRLIRENDCIKVDIVKPQLEESSNECEKSANKLKEMDCYHSTGQQHKFGKNEFEKSQKQPQKLTVKEAFVPELKASNLNKNTNVASERQIASSYKKFSVGAYVHLLNEEVKPTKPAAVKKEQEQPKNAKPVNTHKYFDDEDDEVEAAKQEEVNNDNESVSGSSSSSDSSDGLSEEQVIDDYYQKIKNSKKSKKRASKKLKAIEETSTNNDQQVEIANINQNDLDKIASNVNATGKNKWKNNKQKQTNPNGPKHIIFPSTESSESQTSTSSSSSGTTSSSETDTANQEQAENGEKIVKKKSRRSRARKNKNKTEQQPSSEPKETGVESEAKENQDSQENGVSGSEKEGKKKSRNRNKRNRNKKRLQLQQQEQQDKAEQAEGETSTSRYYEPSKEEQLNALSYNRTFTIQNPKSLVDFKKIFNQAKLNAPNAEEYFSAEQLNNAKQEEPVQPKPEAPKTVIDLHDTNDMHLSMNSSQMSTSTSAESISSSSSNTNDETNNSIATNEGDESKAKKSSRRRRRSPRSPKYDYETLESLNGAPRLNDKLAFQILEISSNFTPEISSYKTGTIVEFDQASNEVTIKLNSKYHSILNKPSKFSVVLDHDEEQAEIAEESSHSLDSTTSSIHDPLILKIDWRNLLNVKLLPKEPEQPKAQQ